MSQKKTKTKTKRNVPPYLSECLDIYITTAILFLYAYNKSWIFFYIFSFVSVCLDSKRSIPPFHSHQATWALHILQLVKSNSKLPVSHKSRGNSGQASFHSDILLQGCVQGCESTTRWKCTQLIPKMRTMTGFQLRPLAMKATNYLPRPTSTKTFLEFAVIV